MAQAGRFGRRVVAIPIRRRSSARWGTLWLMLLAFAGSAAVASLVLGFVPLRLPGLPATSMPTTAASFPICGGGSRSTCVVDGDTFWLEGTKYRIADIVGLDYIARHHNAAGGLVNGDMVGLPKTHLLVIPGTSHINVFFNPANVEIMKAVVPTFLKQELPAKPNMTF